MAEHRARFIIAVWLSGFGMVLMSYKAICLQGSCYPNSSDDSACPMRSSRLASYTDL
ncbi:hypothetical protein HAX39_24695 [Citrobacter freundii]|nr:hypothetical protein [Citrobacter freundii]